jgi:hypothetical protein
VIGLHLDEVNMMIYSASVDGWINVIDGSRGVLVDTLELSNQITHMHADSTTMRLFVALVTHSPSNHSISGIVNLPC